MENLLDPLAKYRRPGASAPVKNSAFSPSGIKLRDYQAFETDKLRSSFLVLKRGLVKKPETELGLPYSYLTKVISDGYGFGFSLTFSLPFPSGAMVIEIRGEGLNPLLEGIMHNTVAAVQIFDPERFVSPAEGDFDREADTWRGEAVIKEITVTDKGTPIENNMRH